MLKFCLYVCVCVGVGLDMQIYKWVRHEYTNTFIGLRILWIQSDQNCLEWTRMIAFNRVNLWIYCGSHINWGSVSVFFNGFPVVNWYYNPLKAESRPSVINHTHTQTCIYIYRVYCFPEDFMYICITSVIMRMAVMCTHAFNMDV